MSKVLEIGIFLSLAGKEWLFLLQQGCQEFVGIAFLALCHLFRCAGKEKLTSTSTTFGTHINEPVGELDDIQIVLDDNHRIASIYQFLE